MFIVFRISVSSKHRAAIIISIAMRFQLGIIVLFCVICALNAAISKRALMYELGAINPGKLQTIIMIVTFIGNNNNFIFAMQIIQENVGIQLQK